MMTADFLQAEGRKAVRAKLKAHNGSRSTLEVGKQNHRYIFSYACGSSTQNLPLGQTTNFPSTADSKSRLEEQWKPRVIRTLLCCTLGLECYVHLPARLRVLSPDQTCRTVHLIPAFPSTHISETANLEAVIERMLLSHTHHERPKTVAHDHAFPSRPLFRSRSCSCAPGSS